MIMAGTEVCGGGRVGRTRQNCGAFFGADALCVGVGGAGDGAAGADSSCAGAAVGNAGFAERAVDDGKVLRGVSGWSDGVGQAAVESAGGLNGGSGGVWRVRGCAVYARGLRGIVCWRLRAGADYNVGKYSGGASVYRASRIGAGAAEFFVQPWGDAVGIVVGLVAAPVRAAWPAGVFAMLFLIGGVGLLRRCSGMGQSAEEF